MKISEENNVQAEEQKLKSFKVLNIWFFFALASSAPHIKQS